MFLCVSLIGKEGNWVGFNSGFMGVFPNVGGGDLSSTDPVLVMSFSLNLLSATAGCTVPGMP